MISFALEGGGVGAAGPSRVICWLYFLALLATAFSCALGESLGTGYRRWSGVSVGLLLLTSSRVVCWLIVMKNIVNIEPALT
jgi:hypothetical protein